MRRVLVAGALCLMLGSSLSATTVSGCLLDSGSTACYTTGMFSFADSLDWGAAVNLAGSGQSGFGPAFQGARNPRTVLPWNARSVGSVNIFASLGTSFTGTPILTRVDNTFWGYGPVMTTAGIVNQYASANHYFAPTIADDGRTILYTYSINAGGGGICDTLRVASGFPNETPPVPCNDAAFIAMDAGPQRITSIQVLTSDSNAFFINGLQFNSNAAEVPEPGMALFMASGLAGLWLFSTARRWVRRHSVTHWSRGFLAASFGTRIFSNHTFA